MKKKFRKLEMKVAFVGCGVIAHNHIHFLNKLGVKVQSVCDISLTRARLFAEQHGIERYYNNFEKMISIETPQIIHILTPPQTHYNLVLKGLENNCHIIVEKPLAEHLFEAQEIIKIALEKERLVYVDHTRVYNPMVVKARKMIEEGAFGKIVRMEYDYDDPSLDNKGNEQSHSYLARGARYWFKGMSGGVFGDLLPHPISVMLSFDSNLEIKNVHSKVNEGAILEELIVLLESDNSDALIKLSMNIKPLRNILTIYCQKGSIKIDLRNLLMVKLPERNLPNIVNRVFNTLSEIIQTSVYFVLSILGVLIGRVHPYSGLDAILTKFYLDIESGVKEIRDLKQIESVVSKSEEIIKMAFKDRGDIRKGEDNENLKIRLKQDAKTLVTGGTGFIGKVLVNKLVDSGNSVRVICRKNSAIELLPQNTALAIGNMQDENSIKESLNGINTVYHCAAAMSGDWADFYDTTVLGTKNLLKAINDSEVKTLIYISSLGIINYNKLNENDIVDENSALEDRSGDRGFYTRSKREAEELVKIFAQKNNKIRTIIIRPGLVYGKETNQALANSGVLLGKWLIVFGSGNRYLGLNYVENLAEAIIHAADSDCENGTVFHVVDGKQPTVREYIKCHNEMSDNKVIPIFLPIALWKFAFKMIDYLLAIKNRRKGTFSYKFASNSKILEYRSEKISKLTNWKPRFSFIDSMKKIYNK